MLLPMKWLKEYIDVDVTATKLEALFNKHALEVDGVIDKTEEIKDVYVGQIQKIEKHPDADKLSVCQVTVGDKYAEPLQIVCGASNIFEGAVIPVSIVGAILPGDFKIKQSKIRGVESFGMLCSEKELGLADDADGILILPEDAPQGVSILTYLGLDQQILDIDILPNRGDCMSIIGLSREVSAFTGKQWRYPEMEISAENTLDKEIDVKVIVEEPELCPRYMAKIVEGIKIAPSPKWIQQHLESAGIRPINNIVDITNYVLLEMGQPLHAFDYDKLTDKTIVVRRAKDGEQIETLDETKRELNSNMIAICDTKKPIAVAGIMGGADTEISDDTVNVLIEAAYFDPTTTRRSAIKLNLRSDSSVRFEKGVDFMGVERALNRAAQLMVDLGGGKAVKGHIDVKNENSPLCKQVELEFNPEKINRILGMDIPESEMQKALTSLGFVIKGDKVQVPSWRFLDVGRFEDIVEEIARIYGYDNVPMTLPAKQLEVKPEDKVGQLSEKARECMIGLGLSEIITFSISSPSEFDKLGLKEDDYRRPHFKLANPLSIEESVMRTQMVSSVLNVMANNKKRQINDLKIFEIGRTFPKGKDGKPDEQTFVAAAITGANHNGILSNKEKKNDTVDFYDAKGILENLLESINIKRFQINTNADVYFHPGRTANINIGKDTIASVAQIHPDVAKNYGVSAETYYIELNLTKAQKYSSSKIKFKSLPKFPKTRRDTTLWIKDEVSSQKVVDAITKAGGKLLVDVELLDNYKGENAHGDDYKNLTYAMYFQSPEKTLTDDEVNNQFDKVIKELTSKVDAKFG